MPTATVRPNGATERQVTFIEDLKTKRVLDDITVSLLVTPPEDLTKRQASELIDRLLKLPKRPQDAASAGVDRYAHLRDLPKSYYALWYEQVHLAGVTGLMNPGQELLFLRVNPWKDRVYMDRLHGSYGGFTKSKLTHGQEVALAAVIRKNPAEAGKRFADKYTRCARCGAELTEDDSRARGYGPTCWGYMS